MRIAAHIGVKDEVELIDAVIRHLKSIGVDLFLVCDMYSTDGTAEILERHRSNNFRILNISNHEPGHLWLQKNQEAVEALDADWVTFLDADEFLLPATGSLKDSLGRTEADLLEVRRFNIPLGPNGPLVPTEFIPARYDEVKLIVKAVPKFRSYLVRNPTFPWIRAVPMPKVIVRKKSLGMITDGMHDIVPTDKVPLRREVPQDLVIAHEVLTSASRFARKIENIREYLSSHDSYFGPDKGWHWRRWLVLAANGHLEREFASSIFSHDLLEQLVRERVIQSAAEVLSLRNV